MSPTLSKRLARRLGGAHLAPRPCALRRLSRARVAQDMPENPAAPAHALGDALHAGAFRQALGRGRMLRCFNPSSTGLQARSLPASCGLPQYAHKVCVRVAS